MTKDEFEALRAANAGRTETTNDGAYRYEAIVADDGRHIACAVHSGGSVTYMTAEKFAARQKSIAMGRNALSSF